MSEEIKTITYYKGKSITELSREELIDALSWASKEIEHLYKKNEHDREYMFETFIKPNKYWIVK